MNLKGLPTGTKLIWDAPEPYKGYAKNPKHPERVFYPAIIVEEKPKQAKDIVRVGIGSGTHFMGYEQDYLRLPTPEEIKTENWDKLYAICNNFNLKTCNFSD